MTKNQKIVADLIKTATDSRVHREGDKLWVQAGGESVNAIWRAVKHLVGGLITDSHVGTNYIEFTVA